jgi:hypothetical protein
LVTLESWEKVARIVSLVALPIVVGVVGYEYQAADREKFLALEYVKLSIELVKDRDKIDPDVQDWAIENLNSYSRVKMKTKLQESLKKGTSSVDSLVEDGRWFTVVATVSTQREAERLVHDLEASAPPELSKASSLSVYRTKISNSFAITVGQDLSKSEALRRTRIARDSGWVPDAFAQRDREWQSVKEPATPDRKP